MKKSSLSGLLKTIREDIVPDLLTAAGIPMTYHPDQLDKLEQVIDDLFSEGPPQLSTTVIPFGFYLGETLVRHIDQAEWAMEEETGNIMDISVKIPGQNGEVGMVYPFRRALKYFIDRTDGLAVFYRTVELMSLGGVELVAQEGKWVNMPNGDRIRMTSVSKN